MLKSQQDKQPYTLWWEQEGSVSEELEFLLHPILPLEVGSEKGPVFT